MNELDARQEPGLEAPDYGWLEDISILLVEDHEPSREALAAALEDQGAHVTAVACVSAAIAPLDRTPDVVISDIELPGESGFDLIRQLRASDSHHSRHTPAIAVTGLAARGAAELVRAAGFDDYVAKPLDLGFLVERIRLLVV